MSMKKLTGMMDENCGGGSGLDEQYGGGPIRVHYDNWVSTDDKQTVICKCPKCLNWNTLDNHVSSWGRGRLNCTSCNFRSVIILHRFGKKLNAKNSKTIN